MARTISDEELQLKKRARRRLVGAIVLVTAIVVALPMVLDTEPKPITGQVDIKIPSTDSGAFTSRVVPVGPPAETKAKPAAKPVPEVRSAAKSAAAPEEKRPAAAAAPADKKAAAEKTAKANEAAVPAPAPKAAPAKAAVAEAPDAPFVVQVVALADAGKAKELQAQITGAGIKSYTEVVKTKKGDVTRVRAGPYASRDQAEKARDQLKAMGLGGNVISK
jgi:DedD protein